MKSYIINGARKEYWIRTITSFRGQIVPNLTEKGEKVLVELKGMKKEDISPIHIVLLACFLESLIRNNYSIKIKTTDDELHRFLFEDLKMTRYFNEKGTKHISITSGSILNLWKIVDNEAEGYSISVEQFFKRNYFEGLDLTALKVSMDEIFRNIADHSQSDGNAFSYVSYDPGDKKIHFASCDFGVGIVRTLRGAGNEYERDVEALIHSLDIGVSAKTHGHNRGFGLDTIVSNLSGDGTLRIVSNRGLLFCKENKENIKTYPLDFEFEGCLTYFDINIDSFVCDETVDEGTL